MKPAIKSSLRPTFHFDGTVSYWSTHRQQWVRQPADAVPDYELAAMNDWERRRIAQVAYRLQGQQA